jgi:hypothetical protein
MNLIKAEDLITSIADSLQFISYFHPDDFVQAMYRAYQREKSDGARDAIAQILVNSRMCALGKRPICQDTGIVNVFVKLGMQCRIDSDRPLQEIIDEGVALAYSDPSNPLRKSIVADPLGARTNTKTNTPPWFMWRSSAARLSLSTLPPKAAARKIRAKWPCSTRPLPSSTGSPAPFPPWAPAGAPRVFSASGWAAPSTRQWSWPRNR